MRTLDAVSLTLQLLEIPLLRCDRWRARSARRHFPPLADAPKIQGRLGEMRRLITRGLRSDGDMRRFPMKPTTGSCARCAESADAPVCAQFMPTKIVRSGNFKRPSVWAKACIYDMPIGYYPAWEHTAGGARAKSLSTGCLPVDCRPAATCVLSKNARKWNSLISC